MSRLVAAVMKMPAVLLAITLGTAASASGCRHEPASRGAELPAASVGVAMMDAEGTIVRDLRAEARGVLGDAQLRYPRSHEEYGAILQHLGGLSPGESKPVPPWPDADR